MRKVQVPGKFVALLEGGPIDVHMVQHDLDTTRIVVQMFNESRQLVLASNIRILSTYQIRIDQAIPKGETWTAVIIG